MNIEEYFQQHRADTRLFELAKNYLARKGWFDSLSGESKDSNGGDVPWITYSAATMLSRV